MCLVIGQKQPKLESARQADDVEDGWAGRRTSRRPGRIGPLEGSAREGLEPLLVLRVGRRRLELQVQMRPGGVSGRAHETDRLSCRQLCAEFYGGVEIRKVAVGPGLTVRGLEREAHPATRVRGPGIEDGSVR